jgi:NAD(P)-dependent dehydrogenase (short-subunit alcohol dehydrogenase family)
VIRVDLSGKTVLITVALGAIAERIARRLADAGATLVLSDNKENGQAQRTLNDRQIPASS